MDSFSLYQGSCLVVALLVLVFFVRQRLLWKPVVGILGEETTRIGQRMMSKNRYLTYAVQFSLPAVAQTTTVTFYYRPFMRSAPTGFSLYKGKPVVLLVHPTLPQKVRFVYFGDKINLLRVWLLPLLILFFVLALAGSLLGGVK